MPFDNIFIPKIAYTLKLIGMVSYSSKKGLAGSLEPGARPQRSWFNLKFPMAKAVHAAG